MLSRDGMTNEELNRFIERFPNRELQIEVPETDRDCALIDAGEGRPLLGGPSQDAGPVGSFVLHA
jgi:hypothetical protein